MDFSQYVSIDRIVADRLHDLRRTRYETQAGEVPMTLLAKVLYIASTLRARPRPIDRYIDDFGDRAPQP